MKYNHIFDGKPTMENPDSDVMKSSDSPDGCLMNSGSRQVDLSWSPSSRTHTSATAKKAAEHASSSFN
jgi:hypothetical protein